MNWVYGIQRAIDYIEANITEKIDYEKVAKQAYSSVFHFQRIFGVLCGYTLGEYIRMRRLTLAAEELMNTEQKIIDIALKYGYDTPESFTRAFSKFHGYTPTEIKNGKPITTFSRLSVKLVLSGGNLMNYRIEKKDAFKVICKTQNVVIHDRDLAIKDVCEFWDKCDKDGTIERLSKYAPQKTMLSGILGICLTEKIENGIFPYCIGFEYDGQSPIDDEFEIIDIPSHTYVVFKCEGNMPQAYEETYRRIVSEFFPQNEKYEYINGIEIESYSSGKMNDSNCSCEIRISVNDE